MKGFLALFTIVTLCALTGCATKGTTASYEGYNTANQGNPASASGAATIAPITSHIHAR